MRIHKATPADLQAVTALLAVLYDMQQELDELTQENTALLADDGQAIFLAKQEGESIGAAHVSLRHDYVEGANSSPVGFLEGIYVTPFHRKTGVARALTAACEEWAKQQGCSEMGSDCELTNTASQRFHTAVGYRETNRTVWFLKQL